MTSVTVVDYGAGNLLNVVRALEHCGASPLVTALPGPIRDASRLILPGVGAFGDCMRVLEERGLADGVRDYVVKERLFLGICVGMQVMFDTGEEFGDHAGLGIIPGKVARIPAIGADGTAHKIPHIGWSQLKQPEGVSWDATPLAGNLGADMYFIHSYQGMPAQPEHRLADADYDGLKICAMVRKGNSFGCQFHPEKSGKAGLALLQQFLQMAG